MLEAILTKCDERLRACKCNHVKCTDCKRNCDHPLDCEPCLTKIHFPHKRDEANKNRTYDCEHLADTYVCKYSCRYASDIVHAIKRLGNLNTVDDLKVLSLGCGPCTDLFGIKYLRKNRDLQYSTLEYRGIDCNRKTWATIHEDIKAVADSIDNINFIYQDMHEYIVNENTQLSWIPDVIIFQYVFSDMTKIMPQIAIRNFIADFACYYNKLSANVGIIINDTNLDIENNGGRDYFDELEEMVKKLVNIDVKKGHFHNEKKPSEYNYGELFIDNNLFFDIDRWKEEYNPFESCSGAQMIIRKSNTETK